MTKTKMDFLTWIDGGHNYHYFYVNSFFKLTIYWESYYGWKANLNGVPILVKQKDNGLDTIKQEVLNSVKTIMLYSAAKINSVM